jgi:ubiquinone/menaquinone biosynthesis C-methylase UbiE
MSTGKAMARDTLGIYSDTRTVDFYVAAQGLQRGETKVFAKYIQDGDDILDIGVGGGRTTPYLSARAGRYLGVDYAEAMVNACRQKFPDLSFVTLDASNLNGLADASFDVVVFSFNGIDCLPTDEMRLACLRSVRRVLRPGGVFIFSSHNARVLFVKPDYEGANLLRRIWRTVRLLRNLSLVIRQLGRKAFYKGEGYIVDPVHGGHFMHVTTPRLAVQELQANGFSVLDTVNAVDAVESGEFTAPGYYYVARKTNVGAS